MKNLQPIQTTFNIPPEEISITQICEVCNLIVAEHLIATETDAFYACRSCAIKVNQITEMLNYLPN